MRSTAMNRNINFHQVRNARWFEDVISHLKAKYTLITAGDLEKSISTGEPMKNTCHLTFDDGDISFYEIVLPVLRKHKVPATLFVSPMVCSERINFWFQDIMSLDLYLVRREIERFSGIPDDATGKISTVSLLKSFRINQIKGIIRESSKKQHKRGLPFRNVNVQQLKDISTSGLVTIGAHTLNHPILKNEDDVTSRKEIIQSVADLAGLLSSEIRYFAYPNGIAGLDYTQREKNILKECGIRLAFENESEVTMPVDDMSIPRIAVSDGESLRQVDFKLMLPGVWYSLKRLQPSGEYMERTRLSRMMKTV